MRNGDKKALGSLINRPARDNKGDFEWPGGDVRSGDFFSGARQAIRPGQSRSRMHGRRDSESRTSAAVISRNAARDDALS